MLNYAIQVLIVLILTTIGKKYTRRLRPEVSNESRRWVDFRTKETNGSLPSGDTAQAALLACFIRFNFPYFYESLGSDYFAFKFIILVAIARVFHHCHFFGDTFIGAAIGISVATIYSCAGIIVPSPI